ncbi:alpha/beta hydrolase [Gordonia jinghuaiqii]|uniref:alpha/beta hydrolase n=1 Tax=Gordonia jinghuaiqii TaxID=2758710 RepID=UPI00374E1C5A
MSISSQPVRTMTVRVALLMALVAMTLGLSVAPASAAPKPTIVLVHGAFADSSGWRDVASNLRGRGYAVQTFDNPLRSPRYDAGQLKKKLATIPGPIVLVGHSYGGFVISNTHDPDVKANVFVAAFAPVAGEFVQGMLNPIAYPGSRLLPPALQIKLVEDDPTGIGGSNVDGYIARPYFREVFAQDVSPGVAANMFAHQKSVALVANLEPSGAPSWAKVPSWYLVSQQDRVVPPALQRSLARRAAPGRTAEVNASHVSHVSRPDAATSIILRAATAAQR